MLHTTAKKASIECRSMEKCIQWEEITMQSTGIVRKLDSLGRITLPMELRKSFEIGEREPLEIFTEEDRIIIKKYNPSDIFTGKCEDLIEYRGKKVSRESIRELARIAGFEIK